MKRLLPCAILCASAWSPALAHADSGRLNFHLDLGVGGAAVGAASYEDFGDAHSVGGLVGLALDFQFLPPFALEVLVQAGGFTKAFPNSGLTGAPFTSFSIGGRFRFFDDSRGYLGERGGRGAGNLWLSAHVGWYRFDSTQYGADFGLGYEFSVRRPISIGPMVRVMALAGGSNSGADLVVTGGLGTTFEVMDSSASSDRDRDGISDEDEVRRGTNPRNPDTDRDSIPDLVEHETHTDPRVADTDGDGLGDGYEDVNANGLLDLGETDPRNFDTDEGGVSDGEEVFTFRTNPRDPADDDQDSDGVPNPIDRCAETPSGTAVDAAGCPVREVQLETLDIPFVPNRMRVSHAGRPMLDTLAGTLTSGTTRIVVYVRPSGDVASDSRTCQRRADAIETYLAQHGVARARFEIRAAGADPVADRTADPSVARLEITRP